jgi:hypothetical protein
MAFDVFISYSHQDKTTADAVCSALEAAGIRCWIAPRDVAPGTNWAAALVDAINHCHAMVLVFSSGSNQSKQIHREVERAFEREVPVIPFRIENVSPEDSLAYYMGPVHWLDALTPPLESHLKRLVTSVSTLLQQDRTPEKQSATVAVMAAQSAADTGREAPAAPQAVPARQSSPLASIIIGIGLLAIAAVGALWLYTQRPFSNIGTTAAGCASPICGSWTGTGNNASAQFGGAPFCSYTAMLENAALSATVDASGTVTGAALFLTMVESTVGSCPYPALGTQAHSYSGAGSTSGKNINLTLTAASSNQPSASATFSGQVVNGRLVGTITVHRLDPRDILAWTIQIQTQ